jgi:hypothetical protein
MKRRVGVITLHVNQFVHGYIIVVHHPPMLAGNHRGLNFSGVHYLVRTTHHFWNEHRVRVIINACPQCVPSLLQVDWVPEVEILLSSQDELDLCEKN